jgi:hypothetical protein
VFEVRPPADGNHRLGDRPRMLSEPRASPARQDDHLHVSRR